MGIDTRSAEKAPGVLLVLTGEDLNCLTNPLPNFPELRKLGWGNSWDRQVNVNLLTRDDLRDPVTGITPNRRFCCRMTRL